MFLKVGLLTMDVMSNKINSNLATGIRGDLFLKRYERDTTAFHHHGDHLTGSIAGRKAGKEVHCSQVAATWWANHHGQ